jgi:hypothetical protein
MSTDVERADGAGYETPCAFTAESQAPAAPVFPMEGAAKRETPEEILRKEMFGLLERFGWNRPLSDVRVEYYRYSHIKNTCRFRGGILILRLHPVMKTAPLDAVLAVITILAAKLCRRPVPRSAGETFAKYLSSLPKSAIEASSRPRAPRALKDCPVGRWQDLREVKERVDAAWFGGTMAGVRISFNHGRTIRRMGAYNERHNRVLISRLLDRPDVPDYVLEYLVYHELLHARYPSKRGPDGRQIIHSKEFRRAERLFPKRREAGAWLKAAAAAERRLRSRMRRS